MNTLSIQTPRKFKLFRFLFGENRSIINRKALDKWEELSKTELKKLVEIFFLQKMTEDERKLRACMILYKLKRFHLFLFEPEQMHHLVQKCEWLFQKPLDVQLLPKIGKLYGPGNKLSGYSGYEFIFADTYFMRYAETQDIKFLDKLISILYRPKRKRIAEDFNGDLRKEFNPYQAKQQENKIAKLPEWMKYAVFLYYKGCREEWEQLHNNLFNQQSPSNSKAEAWDQIMLRISGKEFGDYDSTLSQPIHTLFRKMDLDVKDYNSQKRQHSNNS